MSLQRQNKKQKNDYKYATAEDDKRAHQSRDCHTRIK